MDKYVLWEEYEDFVYKNLLKRFLEVDNFDLDEEIEKQPN